MRAAPCGLTWPSVDLTLTLILLGGAVAFGALCGWRGARPPDIRRGPRMAPWRFMMLLSATFAFLLLIHLVFLLGGRSPV